MATVVWVDLYCVEYFVEFRLFKTRFVAVSVSL